EREREMREEVVVIVGAGQSGLATAACLTALSVPCLILERDDCIASIWRKRCYDRVTLHLKKQYSQLPHAPHPPETPTYMPKWDFIRYLDDYAARFRLRIDLRREVVSAEYDEAEGRWRVKARRGEDGGVEEYAARYLVVASGENDEMVVPEIPGLAEFGGTVVHSSVYRSGSEYEGKAVLVVGCGNSGMEVALDLAEHGARTCIVVRSRVCVSVLHIVSKEIWAVAMLFMRFLPCRLLDSLILLLCRLKFGDLSEHGLHRPRKGPMYLKKYTRIYPVVDVGTVEKIKSGEIQVLNNGHGLQGDDYLIDEDGMAKQEFPGHWKGKNRLYCAGLATKGIYGCAEDAEGIASDIACDYRCQKR
ncbi:hypothetical protein BHE74_00009906, partial [Ensete ventricosum]